MDILKQRTENGIYTKYQVSEQPAGVRYATHVHSTYELYWFASGEVTYLVEGTRYPLTPGSLLLMRPAEAHQPQIFGNTPYARYVVNFPPAFFADCDPEGRLLRPFTGHPLGMENCYSSAELPASVADLFSGICTPAGDAYARRLSQRANLLYLLQAVCAAWERRSVETHSAPSDMVAYVNAHLSDPLTVPELAAHFYRSPSQFSRLFRKETGASPWTYITIKRLLAASARLEAGESVQSVFGQSGFSEYSSFYRAYVRYFGHPPCADKK